MQNEKILVLGSKPDAKLPKLDFKKIYAANGAASRFFLYKKKYKKTKFICVTSKKNFEKNPDVRERIIKSKPDRLYVRFGKIDFPKKLKNCKFDFIDSVNQLHFQKKFFKFNYLSLILGEFFYKESLYRKFKRFLKLFNEDNFQGISTGFYAILLAIEENPKSKIIVSGIGLSGGGHFYKSQRSKKYNYDARSAVDRYLIKFLFKKFKKKILSVDNDFIEFSNVKKYNQKFF